MLMMLTATALASMSLQIQTLMNVAEEVFPCDTRTCRPVGVAFVFEVWKVRLLPGSMFFNFSAFQCFVFMFSLPSFSPTGIDPRQNCLWKSQPEENRGDYF